jgi:hypothetical protein
MYLCSESQYVCHRVVELLIVNECHGMWKVAAVVDLKILVWHFPGSTEDKIKIVLPSK